MTEDGVTFIPWSQAPGDVWDVCKGSVVDPESLPLGRRGEWGGVVVMTTGTHLSEASLSPGQSS